LQTKIIPIDFTAPPQSIYPQIESEISELEIGILVNNVGVGHWVQYFHDFASSSGTAIEELVACNVLACTKMTAIVLPKMLGREKGLIINLSSTLGRFPTPLMSAYSASKAYVDFFSRSLMGEYANKVRFKAHFNVFYVFKRGIITYFKGIRIQSLCPFFVSTKMTNVPPKFWSPTPTIFVRHALKTIRTQPVSSGYIIHNLQVFIINL
jgi:17beta-estradiol 17-dehydrogenase / very-long-chain 3-oxoacyl-CoA reductase